MNADQRKWAMTALGLVLRSGVVDAANAISCERLEESLQALINSDWADHRSAAGR